MKIISVTQGTAEWANLRAQHNTASEAPAMMGVSKHQTRDELLRQKATGIVPVVSHYQQVVFDRGHAAEAAARVILEALTDEEFYPITAVSDDGKLLASVDGITLDDFILFEHKLFNEKLAAQVRAGELEPHYYWQLEQQLLVTGAQKVIFVCSDGTRDNWEKMEYLPVPSRAAQLCLGWTQFDADKAAYVPPVAKAPAPTGRAPKTLPALLVNVRGEITASTFPEFKEIALEAIRSVNRQLETDQDFANAETTVKWCIDIEDRIVHTKQYALSQTADIDALFKEMDEISAEARQVRLDLNKLVAARKIAIKTELVTKAQTALREHVTELNERLGGLYMPPVQFNFAGAIHGKKNLDSVCAALNTGLANGKIQANSFAELIQANLATLQELASAHKFLFADVATIVLKANDHLTALVKNRIAEHQSAELAKEEATRQRIRTEEQAFVQEMKAVEPPMAIAPDVMGGPVAIKTIAPAAQTPPTLKLGQIGERLGFNLSGEFLKNLGFEPAARDKSALLFHEADFPLILTRLVAHIREALDLFLDTHVNAALFAASFGD